MSGKLEGKVAVVTGGNSGIGLATAKRFVAEGAYVFITGRRQEQLDAAVKEIGHNVTGVRGDVAKLGDLDRLYDTVKATRGRVDIVFANAGAAEFAPLGNISEEHFDRIFSTNVKGLLFTVQKALPLIPDGGSIILNASIVASTGNPAFSVYSATKAAVRSFARTWILDLKERKIRVNAISPGPIATPGLDGLAQTEGMGDQLEASLLASVPLGRFGTPDEIASAAVFLGSDESGFVTGTELFVDGGAAQVLASSYPLFVEEGAEDRGQDLTIMALDVRVEHAGQGQEGLSEIGAILHSLQFTLGTRRQCAESGHQLAHLLTFVLQGVEQRVCNCVMRRAP